MENTSQKPSVLLVDDEPDILELLQAELSEENYQVFTANGGQSAFSAIQQNSIDFCVSDIHMPHGDGPELLGLIQKNIKNPPIMIFMTAYRPDLEKDLLKLGAQGIIFKPFTCDKLIELLNSLDKTCHKN